jgi:hypothetical protein
MEPFFTCVHYVSMANYSRYVNRNFLKTVYKMKCPTVYENTDTTATASTNSTDQ